MTKKTSTANHCKNDIKKFDAESSQFTQHIINLSVGACSPRKIGDIDIDSTTTETQLGLKALNAKGGLQEMLAAQMLAIHQLQQQVMFYANRVTHIKNTQYFTNAAVKLANCFTQQVNTLSRLQGNISHKITVEHVDVHHGGQAIVGNINGYTSGDKEKK